MNANEGAERTKWEACLSHDDDLNFMAYLANLLGLYPRERDPGHPRFPAPNPSPYPAVDESVFERVRRSLVRTKADHPLREWNALPSVSSNEFQEVSDAALRQVCIAEWRPFLSWWHMPAGGSYALSYWESAVPVQRYVEAYERQAGRGVRSFRLDLLLVYWGMEIEQPRPGFLIVPLRQGHPLLRESWWMDVLARAGA